MQARRLPAARGTYWLFEGFRLFRRNPPFITALTLFYLMLVQGVAMLLPGIGSILLPLILPAMTLIVANGCRLVDEGQRPSKDSLLRGLTGTEGNSAAMLRLGGLQLAGAVLLVAISTALGDGIDPLSGMESVPNPPSLGMESAQPDSTAGDSATPPPSESASSAEAKAASHEAASLNALLRLMLLAAPLIIAFWFAPFLTGWDRVSPMKALFFSTVASWRNWRALGMFSLGVIVMAGIVPGFILLAISQISGVALSTALVALRMLLIFFVAPVLTASIYVSYRDIFHPTVDENA